MHLAPSALEKKEFRETWQVTALRDRVRTRYSQRKETRVLQEARRFPCVHLLYLSESQLERIKPFFPRSHGAPRVDDRRVVSDIIYGLPDVRLHHLKTHHMASILLKKRILHVSSVEQKEPKFQTSCRL
mgnify:CR=1 FL=1